MLVAFTVKVVFGSLVATLKIPVLLIEEVGVCVPVTVQSTDFGAKPVVATTAVICWVPPLATVAVAGVTSTLCTLLVSVVNRTAFENGE